MLDVMPFDETSETELALHVSEEQAVGFNRLLHRTQREKEESSIAQRKTGVFCRLGDSWLVL